MACGAVPVVWRGCGWRVDLTWCADRLDERSRCRSYDLDDLQKLPFDSLSCSGIQSGRYLEDKAVCKGPESLASRAYIDVVHHQSPSRFVIARHSLVRACRSSVETLGYTCESDSGA